MITLQIVLTAAAALIGVGLFGALSQQSIVMIMMGLELIVGGVMLGGGAAWFFLQPEAPDAQMLVVVALVLMAIEMAMGFAAALAIYRTRGVDMVDMAADLNG